VETNKRVEMDQMTERGGGQGRNSGDGSKQLGTGDLHTGAVSMDSFRYGFVSAELRRADNKQIL
jgi:hypothetical protein